MPLDLQAEVQDRQLEDEITQAGGGPNCGAVLEKCMLWLCEKSVVRSPPGSGRDPSGF